MKNEIIKFDGCLLVRYCGQTRFSGECTTLDIGSIRLFNCDKSLDNYFKHNTNNITCYDYEDGKDDHKKLIQELIRRFFIDTRFKVKQRPYILRGKRGGLIPGIVTSSEYVLDIYVSSIIEK